MFGCALPRRPGDSFRPVQLIDVRESATFRLATFNDTRGVDFFNDASNCKPGFIPGAGPATPGPAGGPGDAQTGEKEYCPNGWSLGLFPSTYIYVVATVVDPNAQYWNRAQGQYVTGPLRTRVFYQFAGVLPGVLDRFDSMLFVGTLAAVVFAVWPR